MTKQFLNFEWTPRGFRLFTFKDANRAKCSLQESSLVQPRIWLGMDEDEEGNQAWTTIDPVTQHKLGARMELTQKQAKELLPLLKHFAKTGKLPTPPDYRG
jgi:hypothetical protein